MGPTDGPYAFKAQQERKDHLTLRNWDGWKELVQKHRAGIVELSKHLTDKHETVS